jgi:hypothetical protein
MSFQFFVRYALLIVASSCFMFPVQSQTQILKRKAAFNLNWKFYKGTPTGTPSAATYSDASWENVAVPHSPSYDSTAWSAEINHYVGDCWYRKTFTVPAGAQKVFIEFEGAMLVANVWVNGTQVGIHNNSGYTPFYYDITANVIRGGSNVVALKLNNAVNADIPPGAVIDFNLFGGLYRNVWLRFKDSVYIPIYSQQITTENISSSNAVIHARTAVKNDANVAKTCQVAVTLLDAANTSVASQTATLTIPAGTLDTFDMKTAAVSNPHLWSPSSPYMYSVQTLVRVGGLVVDSVVEPCGIRWFTWTASQGLSLNGSRIGIKGMCLHQTEGWIGDAVPVSRHYQEVKQLKNLGCNSLRTSHYPRDQAFYDICDKIGMLLYVEIPSWGWGQYPSAARWARMDSCLREMMLAGRNHPSIYVWGLYNEPVVNGDFTANITPLNNTAHRFDTTRFTAVANIAPFNACISVADVEGLNYTRTGSSTSRKWLGTETRNGFYWNSYRGSPIDLDTTDVLTNSGSAAFEWNEMKFTLNTTGQLAGQHFWCYKDYNSSANTNGYEGVVDRLTVPKTIFYYFRQKWTGEAPDYPRGGTATKIDFQSDTNIVRATGSEVFLLTATMRDANNSQIASATGNVTFTVNPASAGTIFGGNTQKAMAGRAGVLLKAGTTPGAFTVTAAYTGLPSATLTLTLDPVSESYSDGTVPVVPVSMMQMSSLAVRLTIRSSATSYLFQCPPVPGKLSIINSSGRRVFEGDAINGHAILINRFSLGTGLLYAVWTGDGRSIVSRFVTVGK